ncbi:MAG: bifunctional demethylmenaquinone methyltransferase/2-methoxy-6-polyprenyl-1,4-benzoquinol methylase UbiE [Hellea sp.]|jgi:demethylmenaquinone methyltransferase/2-methoxy-6-polyprenyl-1,4-benzoquinol methylase|nr:bifunctional demethylmenaquinone methyltransferase/2-methoxy-6-polyprenyl-1,4-benzoquinol methylase UbiE [Hellea sp.]
MKKNKIDFGYQEIPVEEKKERVKNVFNSVAGKYDLMNDAMSFGVHRLWKNLTITKINPQPGEILIDVAGGTGDLARRFLKRAEAVRVRRGGSSATAHICDINDQMLLAGIDQIKDKDNLSRVCGDAQKLPFSDNYADALSIAFGIRNVTDRQAALKQFFRVLKPGGRMFVLEFSTPKDKNLRKIYDSYSFNFIPKIGNFLAGDADSYQYLVESIRKFPKQNEFSNMIVESGFSNVSYRDFSGGIATLYWGWKI